jgi:hypothetical protein
MYILDCVLYTDVREVAAVLSFLGGSMFGRNAILFTASMLAGGVDLDDFYDCI